MTKLNHRLSLFLFIFIAISSSSHAQEVDTIEIDGKSYFVYPFSVEADMHSNYFNAQKKSSLNRGLSYDIYREMMAFEIGSDVEFSRKDFRKMKRNIRQYDGGYYEDEDDRKANKYLNSGKLKKAIRANPYPLLQQRFPTNNDLTPMLDPIPDGEYVQLYEEFCLFNDKGECESVSNQVAGYFTLKNNILEGEATWVDLKGDTLKHGFFVNGIKEGEWKFEVRSMDYILRKDQADLYIERGFPDMDTLTEFITYRNGAKDGLYRKYENSAFPVEEGTYKNGETTGTWIYRDIIFKGLGSKRRRVRENELITSQFTYESNDTLVVHPRWLRKGLVRTYGVDPEQFNFYSKYSRPELPSEMYEIAYEKEENLELDEEMEGAPYDMDYYDEEYYDEMYFDEEMYMGNEFGYDPFSARSYDSKSDKYILRGVLLDSIGAYPNYSGDFEARYDNGQLAFRYTFENGLLVEEDTLFWDNGIAHDVITELPDSNQYLRSIYDYDGKRYMDLIYDSLGDFVRVGKEYEQTKKFMIEGFETYLSGNERYYFYDQWDTLGKQEMLDSTILFRSWFVKDSTKLYTATYYPSDKRFTTKSYSVTGKEMLATEKNYADNFESWTGKSFIRVNDLELETTKTGALIEFYEPDSIPIRHLRYADKFNVANEYILKKNGAAYTGSVELKMGEKNLKFSKKDLTISLPDAKETEKKLKKDVANYQKTGKTNYPIILDLIDAGETDINLSGYIFDQFFADPLGGFFRMTNSYYYNEENARSKSKDASAYMTKVEGFMVNGKPNGTWISYDQFGKKMIEVPYLNGEVNGKVTWYDYAMPFDNEEYPWMEYEYDYENPLRDSFPKKRVHYVSDVTNYVNGKEQGKSISYSWYGGITAESNYEDGYLDGKSVERNKLATTEANYKYGQVNGYVRTYLTLTPGDSILLYNLNFQDGMLQGESKSFHTNGKLAKRGFFLDGQPIEDYEAYDTLGFKYHYVKFQYSYPVEEKIWEENELSVRYLFDWQDSIYFEPSDITTSQSLESVISELGLGGDYFRRPYYGRRSLVNKNGIGYHMTKYYPNDTISRDGDLKNGRKIGCWKYYSYNGELLYEVDYQDSIIEINDSIKFKSKGVLTDFDKDGNPLYESYVIEMSSKYDCSHTDHYEVRQLYTRWEANDSLGRMNGFVQNFYDNGTLQSEGTMKNGLPDGIWKYYDPYGKLNQYGLYVLGKRDARWLSGDLSKTKYLGDICLNPNLPDLEEEIKYRENLLDIKITNFKLGKSLNTQYYDINMNRFIDEDEEELEEGIEEMEE